MKKLILCAALLALLGLPPLLAEQAEEVVPPQIQQARDYISMFYRGELKQVHERFSSGFKQEMSEDDLITFRRQVSEVLGVEKELLSEEIVEHGDYKTYVRKARFEKYDGAVEIKLSIRPDNSVAGLLIHQVPN